jgi:hypothetical protein
MQASAAIRATGMRHFSKDPIKCFFFNASFSRHDSTPAVSLKPTFAMQWSG